VLFLIFGVCYIIKEKIKASEEEIKVQNNFKHVYQFKITLKHIKPPIWRRIQVPENYDFWDLHVAIQDAMGWEDRHLHEFEMRNPISKEKVNIGIPDEESETFGEQIMPEYEQKIANWFSMENKKAKYVYDFGDYWEHDVVLEGILPKEKGIKYPRCIGGKRACPPEDCGSIPGYEEFLEAIKDPKNEMHKEMLDWVGGEFDPESFDPQEVVFDDPDERWKLAFEDETF